MKFLPPQGIYVPDVRRTCRKKYWGLFSTPWNVREYFQITQDMLYMLDKVYKSPATSLSLKVDVAYSGGIRLYDLSMLEYASEKFGSAPLDYFETICSPSDETFIFTATCPSKIEHAESTYKTNILELFTNTRPMNGEEYERFQLFAENLRSYTPKRL